jgi:SAM-dependent methyltransferase
VACYRLEEQQVWCSIERTSKIQKLTSLRYIGLHSAAALFLIFAVLQINIFFKPRMKKSTETLGDVLDGRRIFGDDFDQAEIARWFSEESEGYAGLGAASKANYKYIYHELNRRHGFEWLKDRKFSHALGMGSAYGDEFEPIAKRIGRLTICEASAQLRAASVDGLPINYIEPHLSGTLSLESYTVDLVLCLGVLHHIPNVSYVLSEFSRVCTPGGIVLLREPIVSMGDWSQPRQGLTKNERGLPLGPFGDAIRSAGFSIRQTRLCDFPPLIRLSNKLTHIEFYNNKVLTAMDDYLSRATAWNYRYHAKSLLHKFRPTCAFFVLEKLN